MEFVYILLATLFVSLISLIGIVTLYFKEKFLNKILFLLVSLSIGALMGAAFLHLIPESIELNEKALPFVLVGFFSFFVIEKLFHWRHCHNAKCTERIHTFAQMNLLGDAIHNFLDGLVIAGSFLASPFTGITTTLAIALHEIPQELGDFGVLIYAGFKKQKALLYNFMTALTALIGAAIGFLFFGIFDSAMAFLLAFTAGGFLYIAGSDLVPEIKKQNIKTSFISFVVMVIGVLIIYSLNFIH